MSDKKYDPTMSGYLGDILSGKAKINELRPQHEFFDAIGLEKQLRDIRGCFVCCSGSWYRHDRICKRSPSSNSCISCFWYRFWFGLYI